MKEKKEENKTKRKQTIHEFDILCSSRGLTKKQEVCSGLHR